MEFLISNLLLPYCAALRLVPMCVLVHFAVSLVGLIKQAFIPLFQCLKELAPLPLSEVVNVVHMIYIVRYTL